MAGQKPAGRPVVSKNAIAAIATIMAGALLSERVRMRARFFAALFDPDCWAVPCRSFAARSAWPASAPARRSS
ncbi:MAG: hypothetical protein GX886_01385 [Comamonadaceae bacterium]|nr:hypothetical protein [Rubrivivax sp.]NLZ39906.1 hypothetical protein [Comamonadaceae bacterium]